MNFLWRFDIQQRMKWQYFFSDVEWALLILSCVCQLFFNFLFSFVGLIQFTEPTCVGYCDRGRPSSVLVYVGCRYMVQLYTCTLVHTYITYTRWAYDCILAIYVVYLVVDHSNSTWIFMSTYVYLCFFIYVCVSDWVYVWMFLFSCCFFFFFRVFFFFSFAKRARQ